MLKEVEVKSKLRPNGEARFDSVKRFNKGNTSYFVLYL